MGMGERKMKRYSIGLIIFLFLVPSFAQHTIILKEPGLDKSGFPLEKTSGKAEIIEKDKTIRIKTSKGMKFYSFNDVKEVVEKDGTIIWSYKAYNIREEQRKRNTCLYGIAGVAVIYFLILDNLLEDFTMDPND
tara:strand:+ start:80 stop:481 length:402 start_codon:yes stop_codon:yes gene_type:complete